LFVFVVLLLLLKWGQVRALSSSGQVMFMAKKSKQTNNKTTTKEQNDKNKQTNKIVAKR